jgi:hypothetical protein
MNASVVRLLVLFRRGRHALVALLAAFGFATAAGNANAIVDESPIARVDDIRRRLLESDASLSTGNVTKPPAERTNVAQWWSNWPNWPNWPNWRNWRNF